MSDQYTMFIGIGRNVPEWDNAPMWDEQWKAFKADIQRVVSGTEAFVFFVGEAGKNGIALDETGIPEESFTVGLSASLRTIVYIRDTMPILAHKYRQRAIAVTWGKTDFVSADPDDSGIIDQIGHDGGFVY